MTNRMTTERVKKICEEHDFRLRRGLYLIASNAPFRENNCGCVIGAALVEKHGDSIAAREAIDAKHKPPYQLPDFEIPYAHGLDWGFESNSHKFRPSPDHYGYEGEDAELFDLGFEHGLEIARACSRGELPIVWEEDFYPVKDDDEE